MKSWNLVDDSAPVGVMVAAEPSKRSLKRAFEREWVVERRGSCDETAGEAGAS